MPQVKVTYRFNEQDNYDVLVKLHDFLPGIVARALNTPEAAAKHLAKNKYYVKVEFVKGHRLNVGGLLNILILVNHSPERAAVCDVRAKQVADEVRKLIDRDRVFDGSVYIRLIPEAGYAEF